MFIIQQRDGRTGQWKRIQGYRNEGRALDAVAAWGNANPTQTFRLIVGDSQTVERVVAMRCPSVAMDATIR